MSRNEPRSLDHAVRLAADVQAYLESACERIEVAGSIRRHRSMVSDIELVVVPRFEVLSEHDLWGERVGATVDVLEERVAHLIAHERLRLRDVTVERRDGTTEFQKRNGPAYKALEYAGMAIDLFIVRPPATWGVIFGLRTGPGDWNTKLVMDCKAIGRRVEGGQVLAWRGASSSWEPVPTPTERDFFAAIGQEWIDPLERRVNRVRIQRAIAAAVPA